MNDWNAAEFYALGAVCAAALLFVVLERVVSYNPGQRLFRNGFWVDFVGYNLIQTYLLAVVIAWIVTAIDSFSGLSRRGLISAWPVGLQVLFFVVTHDFYVYWFHRLEHRVPVLWRLHQIHHSPAEVDWISGMRSHPLEILINQTIEFLPIVLLGAAPETLVYKGAVSAVWGMYIHSNLDVRTGWLQYLLNGPEMHRWHHARDPRAFNTNFATKLAVWDWMFGTAFFPRGEKALKYGIDDPDFPTGYWKQTFHALRFWKSPRGAGGEAGRRVPVRR
ncbi:sterol desaturase family protein [Candidatus Methylocalor cossyra]|uniref:Fatty acid hydroxylase n=1 Tax=Candidatus Methylocalor cossyra TaxID=3108543 RepID=A0ABM9NFX4_9GAMM